MGFLLLGNEILLGGPAARAFNSQVARTRDKATPSAIRLTSTSLLPYLEAATCIANAIGWLVQFNFVAASYEAATRTAVVFGTN